MQNWDSLQTVNYEHNWYNNMFHQTIKQEPNSQQQSPGINQLENFFNMKQQELASSTLTPSPTVTDSNANQNMTMVSGENASQLFYDSNSPALSAMQQQQNNNHPLGFNPLTPPGLPNAVLPSIAHFYSHQQQKNSIVGNSMEPMAKLEHPSNNSLTPRNTPPMDVTPPKSPKQSSKDIDQDVMSNSSEDMKFGESEDDDSIRMPIYNSHGKMKNYKCKTCGFRAITKVSFWQHARSHMKPEKTLMCSKCPFVTELKHHLEYHIRKHKNLKPFQCEKCNYTCVNKSMLNSHRKSHSSIYQYRCADCDYATKYCHSFKLHLRKYDHKPGMVLDEDGAPNPSVVIDVYGTRRGPKAKSSRKDSVTSATVAMPQLSSALKGFPLNQPGNSRQTPVSPTMKSPQTERSTPPLVNQTPQVNPAQEHAQQQLSSLLPALLQQGNNPFLPYWNLNIQMLAAQQQAAALAQLSPSVRESALQGLHLKQQELAAKQKSITNTSIDCDEDADDGTDTASAIDLSATTPTKTARTSDNTVMNFKIKDPDQHVTPLMSSSTQSRRKGRILHLDYQKCVSTPPHSQKTSTRSPLNDILTSPLFEQYVRSKNLLQEDLVALHSHLSNMPLITSTGTTTLPMGTFYECKYCDIYFGDAVIYTIHMGYHSCDDIFRCNMCGEKCNGAVGLFVHMARQPHS